MPNRASIYDPTKTYEDNFDNGPFPVPGDPGVYEDQGEPQFEFLGHKLYSPFGVAAGPLLNRNYVKYAFDRGFDVVCYKTQRSVEFPVNPFPNIVSLDVNGDLTLEKAQQPQVADDDFDKPLEELTITNSFAVPCHGPSYWVEDLKKAIADQRKGQVLITGVQGTLQEGGTKEEYYDDFAKTAGLAVDAGAPIIEVNLSCPNVASEGVVCYTRDAVREICRRVRERIGGDVPLLVKFGYFSEDQQQLLEATMSDIMPYIQGVAAINTISAPIVDKNGSQALPGVGRLKAGVCGAGIKWAGLDMVRRLNDLRQKNGWDYKIVGVGGVMSAKDFQEYREAGADVVQSATAMMWNPGLAAEVKASLKGTE